MDLDDEVKFDWAKLKDELLALQPKAKVPLADLFSPLPFNDHLVVNLGKRLNTSKTHGFDFEKAKTQLPDILPPEVAKLMTLQTLVDKKDLLRKVSS